MATNNQTFDILFVILFYIVIVLFIVFIVCYVSRKRNLLRQENFRIPKEIVENGRSHFNGSKVLICGLAKNISKNIGTIKKHLEKIVSFFDGVSHKILIVENDSTDSSRSDLFDIKPLFDGVEGGYSENFIVLCPGDLLSTSGVKSFGKCIFDVKNICDTDNRIMKMIIIRNVYMKYIKQNFKEDEFDYCIILDIDLDFDFCEDSFLSCGHYFSSSNCGSTGSSIGAIGSNSLNYGGLLDSLYYDTYALTRKDSVFAFMHGFFKTRAPTGNIQDDLYKVESCFAGMVIYKYSEIYGRRYFFERDYTSQYSALCEHKSLNRFVNGGIYINPRLVFWIRKNG